MTDQQLVERLNNHPKLRARMESLLATVDNLDGDCTSADAAEQRVIEEMRKLGNESLHSWAGQAVSEATAQRRSQEPALYGNGKKKSVGTQPLD